MHAIASLLNCPKTNYDDELFSHQSRLTMVCHSTLFLDDDDCDNHLTCIVCLINILRSIAFNSQHENCAKLNFTVDGFQMEKANNSHCPRKLLTFRQNIHFWFNVFNEIIYYYFPLRILMKITVNNQPNCFHAISIAPRVCL